MAEKSDSPATLRTGKYTIELASGGTAVYALGEQNEKQWLATAADPQIAMDIVEGLILVETKRFYHPETTPVLTPDNKKPTPPFLKKGD